MGGLEKGGQLGGAATTQLPRTTYHYSRKRKKPTRFTHITMRYGFVLGSRAICVAAPTILRTYLVVLLLFYFSMPAPTPTRPTADLAEGLRPEKGPD